MPSPECPIYCINLPASTDRRARMERRLGHHNLLDRTFFVEAIAAASPLIDERLEGVPVQAADPHRRAVAAVLASHLKAIRSFVEDRPDDDGAIVCEDDVMLHNDWHRRLDEVFANLPTTTSLCVLSYLATPWDETRWAGQRPEQHNLCTFRPYGTYGTMMYWISRSYATQVLARWDIPFRHLPPWAVSEMIVQWSDGLLAYPPLALEDAIDSSLRAAQELIDTHIPPLRHWPYHDYAAGEKGEDLSPLADSHTRHATTIGLAIIARDEEDSLPALLGSCDGAFDEVVLVDTGSEDRTVECFLAWAKTQESTQCAVDHFTWRDDFAAARQYADDLLTTDWKVWADCDDEIAGAGNLRDVASTARPEQGGFRFGYDYARDPSGTCTCYFKRERMVRAGRGRWVGPLHEVQNVDGAVTDVGPEVAEWVHHRERKAVSAKSRPPRPDIAILTAELERNPHDPRTVFYLAQSHRDAGDLARAVERYEERSTMGGSVEEVFYSLYQAGVLRAQQGDWIGGTQSLLQAWEFRPSRTEPLYELAWRFRTVGDHRSAYLFAHHGLDRPQPEDALFVQPWVYRWGLLFEASISAYWVGEMGEAERACRRLLRMPDLPDAHRRQTLVNLEMVRQRETLAGGASSSSRSTRRMPVLQAGGIVLEVEPPWPSVRASIADDGRGALGMIVRTTQPTDGDEPDGDGALSADYLVELTSGLEMRSVEPLSLDGLDHAPDVEHHWDDRLVNVDGSWFASTTLGLGDGQFSHGLLAIAGASITESIPLAGPETGAAGDAWLPFVSGGQLQFLHIGDRILVSRYDAKGAALRPAGVSSPVPWAGQLRDGSQGVEVDDGVLFVVSVSEEDEHPGEVTHRLLLLDADYSLRASSRPFTVLGAVRELCGGLARLDDQLVMSFEARQRATLAVLDVTRALDRLE